MKIVVSCSACNNSTILYVSYSKMTVNKVFLLILDFLFSKIMPNHCRPKLYVGVIVATTIILLKLKYVKNSIYVVVAKILLLCSKCCNNY